MAPHILKSSYSAEVGNNVFFHACWNGSDFIFKILLELGNLSRLVGRHFAVQVASQVELEVWGAQVWGVGAPEGVKASADDAIAKVLLYRYIYLFLLWDL